MRTSRLAMALLVAVPVSVAAQQSGALCVARRVPGPKPGFSAPGLECASDKFSLKVDDRPIVDWSRTEDQKIANLDLKVRHRVRVFCDGKPHQTFTFRFSQFQADELCLFLNDLYQTANLWTIADAQWCKCRAR